MFSDHFFWLLGDNVGGSIDETYPVNVSQFNSYHNIHITRNLKGEFKTYIDKQLAMSGVDNTTTSSEKFGIISYYGINIIDRNTVDNITVIDEVCTPEEFNYCIQPSISTSTSTSSTPLFNWYFIPTVFTFTLILQRRKKP